MAAAQIVFGGYSTGGEGGSPSSSVTISVPAGTTTGDFLIVQVSINNPARSISRPGTRPWTEIEVASSGTKLKRGIYYRVVEAGDPTSYTFTFSGSVRPLAVMARYTGVDAASPIAEKGSYQTGSTSTVTAPALNPGENNTRILGLFAMGYGNADFTAFDWSMTARYSVSDGSGPNGTALGMADFGQATAANFGAVHATASDAAPNLGQLVALRSGASSLDHIQLEYTAPAPLCAPLAVTVKACADTTCSTLYTGSVTVTLANVSGRAWSVNPVSITTGSATTSLGVGSAASATLATSVISPGATYATTCSPSCTVTYANCSFDAVEPSAPAGSSLYTKLAGTAFNVDVLALDGGGGVFSDYVGTLAVELVDGNTGSGVCGSMTSLASASWAPASPFTFAAANAGRKTFTVTYPSAARKVQVRMTDSAAGITSCSSDLFAVRPGAFSSVTSSNANADAGGASNITTAAVIKAGNSFSLTADTGVAGYDGTPKIDVGKLEWYPAGAAASLLTAASSAFISGSFTTAASPANGNGAAGAAFKYGDVGYFRFMAQGVYDDTFTAIDQPGDCIMTGGADDFRNTTSGGKYGCKFGITAPTNHFGRFIPHHFDVPTPLFTPGCPTDVFTYMDQPFTLSATIFARNADNATTPHYGLQKSGTFEADFGRGTISVQMENANSGSPIPANRLDGLGAPAWNAGSYAFVATHFKRKALPDLDGPFDNLDIGLTVSDEAGLAAALRPTLIDRAMDASNTSCIADTTGNSDGTCTARRVVSDAKVRYGRLRLDNAHGSDLLDLPMQMRVQVWNGTAGGWTLHGTDKTCSCNPTGTPATCTGISITGGKLNAGDTCVQDSASNLSGAGCAAAAPDAKRYGGNPTVTPPFAGNFNLWLRAPGAGKAGDVTVTADAPVWLQYPWNGVTAAKPTARATFGVFKSGPVIRRREMY